MVGSLSWCNLAKLASKLINSHQIQIFTRLLFHFPTVSAKLSGVKKVWLVRLSLLFAIASILVACQEQTAPERPLTVIYPPPTAPSQIARDSHVISFPMVQNAPEELIGETIRVQGIFAPLPQERCEPFKGPNPAWALQANALQLSLIHISEPTDRG